jgi:hypothetical protein
MARNKTENPPAKTAASQATNEWGVPDWRDEAAYGDVKRWHFDRWRWEFSRRREDLREYFDQRLELESKRVSENRRSLWRPHDPGFVVQTDAQAAQRFGYLHGLPNPRIGDQPEWAIRTYRPFEIGPNIIDSNTLPLGQLLNLDALVDMPEALIRAAWESGLSSNESRDMMMAAHEGTSTGSLRDQIVQHLGRCNALFLREGQIALKFSLDEPLAEQLESAAMILRSRQSQRHGKKIEFRTPPRRWLGDLRVLDARDATPRPSWSEVTTAFYAQGLLGRRKDPAGGYRAPEPQAAAAMWKAADALRTNFKN